jgi:hypothetical protein
MLLAASTTIELPSQFTQHETAFVLIPALHNPEWNFVSWNPCGPPGVLSCTFSSAMLIPFCSCPLAANAYVDKPFIATIPTASAATTTIPKIFFCFIIVSANNDKRYLKIVELQSEFHFLLFKQLKFFADVIRQDVVANLAALAVIAVFQ